MDLNKLMQEAQKMQERMQEAQQQLTALTVTGSSGGGLVSVTLNGRHEATAVHIKPSLLSESVEILEDLVAAAINDAARRIETASKEKISQLTAGLNLPTDLTGGNGDERA